MQERLSFRTPGGAGVESLFSALAGAASVQSPGGRHSRCACRHTQRLPRVHRRHPLPLSLDPERGLGRSGYDIYSQRAGECGAAVTAGEVRNARNVLVKEAAIGSGPHRRPLCPFRAGQRSGGHHRKVMGILYHGFKRKNDSGVPQASELPQWSTCSNTECGKAFKVRTNANGQHRSAC